MSNHGEHFIELAQGLAPAENQVSQGLNLTLELENPLAMPLLLLAISTLRKQTDLALKELHFVHFARFLPTRDNKALLVITEFDGELQPYVMDFAASISAVFSAILRFIKDKPPLPVHEHPQEFWEFIQRNNKVFYGWTDPWPVYSAYPDKTVLDIVGVRTDLPPAYVDARPGAIQFSDVQGHILRGFHAQLARHFALRVLDAKEARLFLSAVLSGHEPVVPQVTTAQNWTVRPDYFLNIAMTADGLSALGMSAQDLALFPAAFREGPADATRAARNGDVGASDPATWRLGAPGQTVHLLASLYADTTAVLDAKTTQLRSIFAQSRLHELSAHDALRLLDDKVYFGYTDGITQPRIAGVPASGAGEDMQPLAAVGEFLAGTDYTNIYGGKSIGLLPPRFAQNGTFVAVRILEQDVKGFEQLLKTEAVAHGIDPELVAAKLLGRWRNGDPLVRVPAQPASLAAPSVPPADINKFDYAPTLAFPGNASDFTGSLCPVGAHIRRMNPRAAQVAGKPYTRRIIRRGMPYQIAPVAPGGVTEQGLFGIFMCADLERQFEFLMQTWANGDIAQSGIRRTQDPIVGSQTLGGEFVMPSRLVPNPMVFQLPRLVQTKGSLYLFMPGIAALRALAGLKQLEEEQREEELAQAATRSSPLTSAQPFDPDKFNPKDPVFRADPYPFYALFRKHAPVHKIKYHDSYWVFSHELVTEMCEAQDLYLKQPITETAPRGIFYMDPPRHTQVRQMLDPVFDTAIAGATQNAATLTIQAMHDLQGKASMDLVADFAKRIPRDVFMTMFGIPQARWVDVDKCLDTMLHYYDRTLPTWLRLKALLASTLLNAYLKGLLSGCPAHAPAGLACLMKERAQQPNGMSDAELNLTAQNFALGGYLSTQFLLATGVYNLLRNNRAAWLQLQANMSLLPNAIAEMLRFDAPFQMADRFAARDTNLGGVPIPAGSMVVAVYGSANRDPAVFSNPDTFDITRTPSALSYGFGHGDHQCIGAPLVKVVAPAAFLGLMSAFPNLALGAGQPQWLTDPYFRSFDQLALQT